MKDAAFGKITAVFRAAVAWVKKIVKSNRCTYLFFKGLRSLRRDGVVATFRKVRRKLFNQKDFKKARKPLYTKAELEQQKKTKFPKAVKFSILVPLYNTPEDFLREMILSVKKQTYGNWELCLADGSDDNHDNVREICRQYAEKDPRILYQKLQENKGISGNTNA